MNKATGVRTAVVTMILVMSLLVAGCQRFLSPATPQVTLPIETAGVPSTGGDLPRVVVQDQPFDGSKVVVAEVFSNGPGWLAIHTQVDGGLGPPIAYAPLKDGLNSNVEVTVPADKATEVMYAMLHIDANQIGTYEFPGPDVPEEVDGQIVSPEFRVTLPAGAGQGSASTGPVAVSVTDQEVKGGLVKIDRVVSEGPGWLAIHTDNNGAPGQEIGYVAVRDGENTNVIVRIDNTKATPVLYAMLHTDAGEVGTYEFPGPDEPVLVDGAEVAPSFRNSASAAVGEVNVTPAITPTQGAVANTTPAPEGEATATHEHAMATAVPGVLPELFIQDQEVSDGVVDVARVVSSGAGRVAVYTFENGQPGELAGYSPVVDGENLDVRVNIDVNSTSPEMYVVLLADAGQVGTFEFPGPDAPIHVGIQMMQLTFRTDSGVAEAQPTPTALAPEVIVFDQPIRGTTVEIAEVYSVGPGWMGIHITGPDGEISSAIGYTHVNDGLNTNLIIAINVSRATGVMHAMLHKDEGQVGTLEFPGPDVPYETETGIVMTPFNVTSGLPGQDVELNVSGSETPYLVDVNGLSLYISLGDEVGRSNCVQDCPFTWMPLLASGKLVAGEGVTLAKVGVIVLPNGNRQVTYGGLPLYYYAGDRAPGDINGQGQDGLWFLSPP